MTNINDKLMTIYEKYNQLSPENQKKCDYLISVVEREIDYLLNSENENE